MQTSEVEQGVYAFDPKRTADGASFAKFQTDEPGQLAPKCCHSDTSLSDGIWLKMYLGIAQLGAVLLVGISMNKILMATAFALVAATGAQAADMAYKKAPPPMIADPAYSWSGIYIGAHGGWSRERTALDFPVAATHLNQTPAGGFGGGQIGVRQQWGNWVLGAEFSGSYLDQSVTSLCPNSTFMCTNRVRDLLMLTGQAGYAWGPWLAYVRGGWASYKVDSTVTPTFPNYNDSHRFDSGVIGGGVEWAWTKNLSIGAEYLHILPVSAGYSQTPFVAGTSRNVSLESDMVRGVINYKLDWGWK